MSETNTMGQLIEEIELFIRYSVPEEEISTAIALVRRYRKNRFVLRVLREYYAALPEAREEQVVRIAKLIDRQGVTLVVVSTAAFAYLYAVSADEVLLLGEYRSEVDPELPTLLGFTSQEAFLKSCPSPDQLEEYASTGLDAKKFCPACGVPVGEYHLLGCTVEICPWCDGQLSKCGCRYEQLATDEITEDEQLETFVELLTAKGRIPYRTSQAPFYPGTSGGLDRGERKSG